MKIVKLTGDEYRAWRINKMCVVGEDGSFLRDVTVDEVNILRELDKRATASRKLEVAILDEGLESEMRIEVQPVHVAPGVAALKRTLNGHALQDDRSLIKSALLAKHGPCQVRTMAGQPKFTVRDPKAQGVGRSAAAAASGTPNPATCQCAGYAGRQEGRHHWACMHNAAAPAEEQGTKDGVIITQQGAPASAQPAAPVQAPRVRFLAPAATAPVLAPAKAPPAFLSAGAQAPVAPAVPVPAFLTPSTIDTSGAPAPAAPAAAAPAVAPAAPAVPAAPAAPPSPEKCPNECMKYAGYAKDGKHHHVCSWKQPWEAHAAGLEPQFLVHLENGVILREAHPEEIAEAALNLGVCDVAGVPYGVVPQSELAALKEATPPAPEAQAAPASP